jgi:hypothetical protein
MMSAYSLRTWRRNGVACDELLFLPGTLHGQTHGVEGPPVAATGTSLDNNGAANAATKSRSEGDVAAGVGIAGNSEMVSLISTIPEVSSHSRSPTPSLSPRRSRRDRSIKRAYSMDSSIDDDSIQEFVNSWDEYDTNDDDDDDDYDDDDEDEEEQLRVPLAGPRVKVKSERQNRRYSNTSNNNNNTANTSTSRDDERSLHSINNRSVLEIDGDGASSPVQTTTAEAQGPVQRFRENHPRITRIGSFFFFRSSASSEHNATYAPSGPSVVGAALDLCMPVIINFHLYIEAYNHISVYGSETPAKILPLIFLSILIVRSGFPPGRRLRFWSTMKITFMAPFHRMRFRDAFVGDILTSLVRPCQDVLFALSYYVTVVYSTVTGKNSLAQCGQILESSWILHNVVLPSCALLPLWWKFLQTLREAYDTGKRWPALGNAFKYLTASLVILYGMTHPEDRRSPWWLVSFALTCIYQIWWDTMVDWELFVIAPRQDETRDCENQNLWFSQAISSVSPDSFVLLTLQRNIFQPIRDVSRFIMKQFRFCRRIQLRPTRLYKNDWFYWRIFAYNTVLRFTWMLCFIPAYHLSPSGREYVTTFSSDTNSFLGVLLPAAELLRRTFWGFLLLERETIRIMDGDPKYSRLDSRDEAIAEESSEASGVDTMDISKTAPRQYMPTWLGAQQQLQHDAATSSSRFQLDGCLRCDEEMRRKFFVAELSLWAVAFVGLGLWASGD